MCKEQRGSLNEMNEINHNLYFFLYQPQQKSGTCDGKQTVIQPISSGHKWIDRKSGLNHKQTTNRPGEIV